MRRIVIDCAGITDSAALHRALAQALAFPGWYGGNLDALHDCLTDIREETELTLRQWQALNDQLGDYAAKVVFVCHQVSEENPNLRVSLED